MPVVGGVHFVCSKAVSAQSLVQKRVLDGLVVCAQFLNLPLQPITAITT